MRYADESMPSPSHGTPPVLRDLIDRENALYFPRRLQMGARTGFAAATRVCPRRVAEVE